MLCIRDASFPGVESMLPVMVERMLRGSWIVPSTFFSRGTHARRGDHAAGTIRVVAA